MLYNKKSTKNPSFDEGQLLRVGEVHAVVPPAGGAVKGEAPLPPFPLVLQDRVPAGV